MLSWIRFLSNAAQIWRTAPKVEILFEFEKSDVDFLNFDLFWYLRCFGSQNIRYILLQISSLNVSLFSRTFSLFSDCTRSFYKETYISHVEFFTYWSFLNHIDQLKYSAFLLL